MKRLEILPAAEEDLEDIWEYIAVEDIGAAQRVLERLRDVLWLLREQPSAGRVREDLGGDLRRFPAGTHLIFYRSLPDRVEVVRVLDGRRDIGSDLL